MLIYFDVDNVITYVDILYGVGNKFVFLKLLEEDFMYVHILQIFCLQVKDGAEPSFSESTDAGSCKLIQLRKSDCNIALLI